MPHELQNHRHGRPGTPDRRVEILPARKVAADIGNPDAGRSLVDASGNDFARRPTTARPHRHFAVRPARVCVALFAAALAATTAPSAGESQTTLTVTATILKHASLKVLAQPAAVTVTTDDVARGYVDVPRGVVFAIRSNTDGFLLSFDGNADFVRQIKVHGLGSEVQMSGAGGVISQPSSGRGMRATTLDLGFRFELASSTPAGVYAWPVRLSILPL